MKRHISLAARGLVVTLALTCSALSLHATDITPLGSGSFQVAESFANFHPTGTTVIASLAALNVAGVGNVLIDTTGANPGTFFAFNSPTPSQGAVLTFALSAFNPDFTQVLALDATGTPLPSPPVTDPAVAAFLSPSNFVFTIDPNSLPNFDANGNGFLVYNFAAGTVAAAATPEPGSLALMFGGALLLAGRLRRNFRRYLGSAARSALYL